MRRLHLQLSFPHSIHFITCVTSTRGNWFVEESVCSELLTLLEGYRAKFAVKCYGYVLMPDHLHALLEQPGDQPAISGMLGGFKSVSSHRIKVDAFPGPRLWRERFDDVPVPGAEAARTKLDYIHNNPVKRSLVDAPERYCWSSAPHYWDGAPSIVTLATL